MTRDEDGDESDKHLEARDHRYSCLKCEIHSQQKMFLESNSLVTIAFIKFLSKEEKNLKN